MRTSCKYAHEVTYKRWVNGALVDVTVDECWGEKEPTVCDTRRMELCGEYEPSKEENKLEWRNTGCYDEWYGLTYECAKCGYEVCACDAKNYCPHCGYEYEPWDGTTFREI